MAQRTIVLRDSILFKNHAFTICGIRGNVSDKCKRCGLCCVVPDEQGKPVPCKFLREGHCSIYEHRLGTELAPGVFCTIREWTGVDYPGCPYNNNRPIHPAYAQ